MSFINFNEIVKEAWSAYDPTRTILTITDISAKVSTNHVYRVTFKDGNFIIAKLSYFGKFEHFVEDHSIINSLSNNLQDPFENFLARSLIKENSLFVHRHQDEVIDAWVVFYRPVKIKRKLPKRIDETQIQKLAKQFAKFHKSCHTIRNTLPSSSKTLEVDVKHLLDILDSNYGKHEYRMHQDQIRKHCDLFLENVAKLDANELDTIPVFVDWNIGNFSVTPEFKLFSRWDYDWFRISSRMIDFYFFARISSNVGDKTVFSYDIDPMMEDRFVIFLKAYHKEFPLTRTEILFLKEAYRFFILNYVVKYGKYFFHEIFATKLQQEAYQRYLPQLDQKFDPEPLLKALDL
jgi:Ser/Thr protein kinase RdoA (MazF antagonist)